MLQSNAFVKVIVDHEGEALSERIIGPEETAFFARELSLVTGEPVTWTDLDGGVLEDEESPLPPLPPIAHIPSFLTANFQSAEMKRLTFKEEKTHEVDITVLYRDDAIFPAWMLQSAEWSQQLVQSENVLSDIMKTPHNTRSADQVTSCVRWLMDHWKLAESMGLRRCVAMFKEFKYMQVEPGEVIIKEGERGLTFYIIVEGSCIVHKDGVGNVARLTKGQSFGEVALTQGVDLRTATVTADARTEVLHLHKSDYDYYVRDIQMVEKKENSLLLASCDLFRSWPMAKVERLANACERRIYEAGTYVFHQGDPPDALYIVLEGSINIIKEVMVQSKNKWPSSIDTWEESEKTHTKSMSLRRLTKGQFFGEIGVIRNVLRTSSALVEKRSILVVIDKLELRHIISFGASVYNTCETDTLMTVVNERTQTYIGDQEIMEIYGESSHIKGGPNSIATVGDIRLKKSKLEQRIYEKKLARYNFVKPSKRKESEAEEEQEHKIKNELKEKLAKIAKEEQTQSLFKNLSIQAAKHDEIAKEREDILQLGRASSQGKKLVPRGSKKPLAGHKIDFTRKSFADNIEVIVPRQGPPSSSVVHFELLPRLPDSSKTQAPQPRGPYPQQMPSSSSRITQFADVRPKSGSIESILCKSPLVINQQTVVLRQHSALRLQELATTSAVEWRGKIEPISNQLIAHTSSSHADNARHFLSRTFRPASSPIQAASYRENDYPSRGGVERSSEGNLGIYFHSAPAAGVLFPSPLKSSLPPSHAHRVVYSADAAREREGAGKPKYRVHSASGRLVRVHSREGLDRLRTPRSRPSSAVLPLPSPSTTSARCNSILCKAKISYLDVMGVES